MSIESKIKVVFFWFFGLLTFSIIVELVIIGIFFFHYSHPQNLRSWGETEP